MPNEDDRKSTPPTAAEESDRDKEDKERGYRQRLEGLIPDLVKKTFYTGLGAVFATSEQVKEIANDFSLPKDVANYIINSAQGTKDEVLKIIARETREFLSKVDLRQEMAKLLTQLSLEVKTEIRFIPNDEAVGGVKPDVKKKIRIKRVREDGSEEEIDPEELEPPPSGEKS